MLLTGATGFIGQHVARAIVAEGHQLFALRRQASDAQRRLARTHPEIIWLDADALEAGIAGARPDVVLHLATHYGRDGQVAELLEANLVLPLRILQAAVAAGCRAFVHTDTFFSKPGFEYGHLQAYIRSKQAFVSWAQQALQATTAFRLVNLRLEHVYGPGDDEAKFVPQLLARLGRGESIDLTPGEQRRDFIYVEDVAAAFTCIVRRLPEIGEGFSEFEVGTGHRTTLRTFVEMARAALGSASVLNFGAQPYRPGEIMDSAADTTRLNELGWRHTADVHRGIEKTVAAG